MTTGQGLSGNGRGTGPRQGRRQKPRPSGGSPTARLADARRLSPLPVGRWWAAVTLSPTPRQRSVRVTRPTVPTILSPRKITVKGAPSGRVCDGAQTAPPLTLIFHGKPIGTYQVGRGRLAAALANGHLLVGRSVSTQHVDG